MTADKVAPGIDGILHIIYIFPILVFFVSCLDCSGLQHHTDLKTNVSVTLQVDSLRETIKPIT